MGAIKIEIDASLYQWDTGREITITPRAGTTVDEVHFSWQGDSNALNVCFKCIGNAIVAEIPNVLLQNNRNITAYVVSHTEYGERTLTDCTFFVHKRPKPADYVYTETEIRDYTKLAERIEKIEKNGGGISVDAVALLITILAEALYVSDQSENIRKLKEALENGAVVEPDEPETTQNVTAALGVARLGCANLDVSIMHGRL